MTQIEAWLQGAREYNDGLMLYHKYGNNFNLKRVFDKGPNEYNQEKLLSELEAIKHVGEQVVNTVVVIGVPSPSEPVNVPAQNDTYDRSKLLVPEKPEKYHQLHNRWKAAYREASHLHQTKLGMDMHKNDRAKAVFRIMEIFEKEITPIWDMLDFFEENGHWPENLNEPKEYTTPAEMLKRRNNLRTYITKFKGDANKMPQVEAWQKEMEELNTKLDESVES